MSSTHLPSRPLRPSVDAVALGGALGCRRGVLVCLAALLASVSVPLHAGVPSTPGECLTSEEVALLEMVNDYRQQNALAAVPISESLSTVAQWHVWDLVNNAPHLEPGGCNRHSWSDQGPPGLWSAVCYTPDHAQASGMWIKPKEITAGVYTGNGYENAYESGGGDATAAGALAVWKASLPHNEVILNDQQWATFDPWPAMGAGILGPFAVLWFGDASDPQGALAPCGAVFSDGFESGNTSAWSAVLP